MVTPFDDNVFFKRFCHQYFDTPEVRLHYVTGGEGSPLLLLPAVIGDFHRYRQPRNCRIRNPAGHEIAAPHHPTGDGNRVRATLLPLLSGNFSATGVRG